MQNITTLALVYNLFYFIDQIFSQLLLKNEYKAQETNGMVLFCFLYSVEDVNELILISGCRIPGSVHLQVNYR